MVSSATPSPSSSPALHSKSDGRAGEGKAGGAVGRSVPAAAAPSRSTRVRALSRYGVQEWLSLTRQFPRSGPPGTPAAMARVLFGALPRKRSDVGEDVTAQVCELFTGTLLWLDCRIVVSNCFNSLKQLGSRLEGLWSVRERLFKDGPSVVLQRLGDPRETERVDEHRRLHGRCALPVLEPAWSYVADVVRAKDGPPVAEVLRPQGCAEEEPIDRISLTPSLAIAAHHAVVVNEAEEALLLCLSMAGCGHPVPVRLAVYNPSLQCCGPVRVHDDICLTSHQHVVTPPSTATGLASGIVA
mmetsp:Transcript_22490/g.45515  ORF Transcript_22490/g.45515 Transcript_22490/m.45515 type:complete len:299 (+) Transcript_22490:212-1108(+)